jgi:hypothetical protein
MSFTSPAWLWMLTAIVPLVAIYFLKIRPRRLPVNAYFLWQQIFDQKKTSSLFQRLRDLLSLLLLALAIAVLAFAAAGPKFEKEDKRDLLIVIDVSPSMKAKAGDKETFRLAKDRTKEIVQALNGTRRAALASVSGDLKFLCHLSAAPKDLLDSLARMEVSDVPVSESAIRAVNAFGEKSGKSHRVLLLTDGNGGWSGLDPKVEVIRLGGKAGNAGIVAADLAWSESGGDKARFFYRIASTFPEERQAELELRHEDGGGLMRLVPVTLKPNGDASATLDVEDAGPGRWSAVLKINDALAADNEIAMGLADRRAVSVRLDTKDRYFFERGVDAFERTGGLLKRVDQGGELAISQGAAPDDANVLVFAPSGASPFWKSIGDEVEVQAAENKAKDHPLVRALDLDAIRFEGARKIEPAEGSLVLAVSDGGQPLIWKSQAAGRTAVVVNLDPTRGEFFLSPWFPAMVHGAALHLADREAAMLAAYPTGTKVTAAGEFKSPAGGNSDGSAAVDRRGFYQVTHKGVAVPFGGALMDRAETLLDGNGPQASAQPVAAGYPLAMWLIALAAAVLVMESILYHRRKAG